MHRNTSLIQVLPEIADQARYAEIGSVLWVIPTVATSASPPSLKNRADVKVSLKVTITYFLVKTTATTLANRQKQVELFY